MKNQWLQGGPYLQASFIISVCGCDYRIWAIDTINQVKIHLKHLEIALSSDEFEAEISNFQLGYDTGYENKMRHILRLPVYLDIGRKRRAEFVVEKVSSTLLQMQFWFYGSQSDVPSWNMIGVTEKEFPLFKKFVIDLFNQLKFEIATLAYEEDALELFLSDQLWPDESYNLDNLDSRKLKEFEMVICRKGILDSEAKISGISIGSGYIFERDFLPLPI